MTEIGGVDWMKMTQERRLQLLEQYLKVHLAHDGNLRMTQGVTGRWTVFFTNHIIIMGGFNQLVDQELDYLEQCAVRLRYLNGYSDKEIARELHLHRNTAGKTARNGLKKLALALEINVRSQLEE